MANIPAYLDVIINEGRKTGSIVIIISSLGTSDTRPNLHKRRLHNAVARLVDYPAPIPRDQVVTAIGDHVKGKGKVEFYMSGRLVYVVLFKPNADFRMDCCDYKYPNYYPGYKEPKKKMSLHRNASYTKYSGGRPTETSTITNFTGWPH